MMFTVVKQYLGKVIEAVCLSTDTKPVKDADGVAPCGNGSKATEMDTGDVYHYNETGDEWVKA